MKRKFLVFGYKPAHSKAANDLIKSFDLGIDGKFRKFCEIATIATEDDVTQDQLDRQPDAIKCAYEECGCTDIAITEVTDLLGETFPEDKRMTEYISSDKWLDKHIGVEANEDCPECGSDLLRDSTGVKWCSSPHCAWSNDPGMREFLEELHSSSEEK